MVVLLACDDGSTTVDPDAAPPDAADAALHPADAAADATALDAGDGLDQGPAGPAVSYRLTWDTSGAEPLPGGGWRIHNDLGDRIDITTGYLVSHSVQLVPCPDDSLGARLLRLFVGVAHAGHGDDLDPIAVYDPLVESLLDPVDIAFGDRPTQGATYCSIHYLVANALDGETRALPADRDLIDLTLVVGGTHHRDGTDTPFHIETGLAWAALRDLDTPLDTTHHGALVLVERALGTLFDGIDLLADDPRGPGRALLRNLLVQTRFRVDPV